MARSAGDPDGDLAFVFEDAQTDPPPIDKFEADLWQALALDDG